MERRREQRIERGPGLRQGFGKEELAAAGWLAKKFLFHWTWKKGRVEVE